MRVKSCEASDGGASRPIELSDENGCVLRPKMFSKFMKMRSTDARATVVTYAFFHAFKFPDSMAVHIRCKVRRTLDILVQSILVTILIHLSLKFHISTHRYSIQLIGRDMPIRLPRSLSKSCIICRKGARSEQRSQPEEL